MGESRAEQIRRRNRELIAPFEPAAVFAFFADIAAIPRESGRCERIGDHLVDFARRRGLEHRRDAVGNVVIRKPAQRSVATEGVILQAHMDMVCVKDPDSPHDFAADPVEFVLRGAGVLAANGTTLGADDGIGVAIALAFLDSPDLVHPPLEALFTVDEETDMGGARAVSADMLRGNRLINLDAEELGLAYVSSAASRTMHIDLPLSREADFSGCSEFREIRVGGLRGGHSGVQINAGFANAFVLLARVLADASRAFRIGLVSFDSGGEGGAENAIPARARALVALRDGDGVEFDAFVSAWERVFANEYRSSDPGVALRCEAVSRAVCGFPPLTGESAGRFLRLVRLLPLGVFRFAEDDRRMGDILYKDLLVETSCNLGVVALGRDGACLRPMARGSVGSVLDDLSARVGDLAVLSGGGCVVLSQTSGWEAERPASCVQRLFAGLASASWSLVGIHAGLECGCLVEAFARAGRRLHAVSVGPSIENPHSSREILHVGTVGSVWASLVEVLGRLGSG